MKKILALCLPMVIFLGCATATFNPYDGAQQAWPTSTGAVANTEWGMPIYKSAPPRSYEILGELTTHHIGSVTEFSAIGPMVTKAKAIGADALLLVDSKNYFLATRSSTPTATTGTGGSWPSFVRDVGRDAILLAIKWKPIEPEK